MSPLECSLVWNVAHNERREPDVFRALTWHLKKSNDFFERWLTSPDARSARGDNTAAAMMILSAHLCPLL